MREPFARIKQEKKHYIKPNDKSKKNGRVCNEAEAVLKPNRRKKKKKRKNYIN